MRMICTLLVWGWGQSLWAYTANKVWFDFMPDGRYKVSVNYTIPELKEFREAFAIFHKKKEAEHFYWHLLRGGDFSVNGPASLRYTPPKLDPKPW